MNQREKFEAWSELTNHQKRGTQHDVAGWYYFDDDTNMRWDAWQAALAASGGNAAPELTDEQISKVVEDAKVKCVHPKAATTIDIGRAVLKAAQSAPNAALVAVLKKVRDYHVNHHVLHEIDAALSAAGQEP